MRRVCAGNLPVRSTTMVLGSPAGKPMSLDDSLPGAIRHLRFHRWRLRMQARLPCRIHRAGAKVFDVPAQEQPQRPLRRPLAEIQRQRMPVRKSRIAQIREVPYIFVIRGGEQRKHIVAPIVPGSHKRMRLCGREQPASRSRTASRSGIARPDRPRSPAG